MDNIGIGIRAIGDFSDVERAAAEAAKSTNRQFASIGKGGQEHGMLSRMLAGKEAGKAADVTKMFDSVRVALERTGQAGKRLKDIRLSDDFKDAAKHIVEMQAGMDRLSRTDFGRDVKRRARLSGQDPAQPWSWDWKRMGYSDPALAQRRLMGQLGPHGGPHGGGVMRGIAGAVGRTAMGLAEAGGASPALVGGGVAIGAKMAAAGPLIVPLVLAAAGALGVKAYQLRASSFRSDDSLSKATGTGFDAVHSETRTLADDLHLTAEAAGKLRVSFMRASGSIDDGTMGRVSAAGQFGRGYGVDPGATAMQFAKTELVGYGKTKTDQRDFAGMIASGVAGAGMFARVEQYMGDVAGFIGSIASTQNRTAGKDEVSAFSEMLSVAYGKDANRGGGAMSLLGAVARAGGGGSDTLEAIAWGAYGDVVGGDLGKFETMKEAPLSSSAKDLFGEGFSDKTKFELLYDYNKKYIAPGMPAAEADDQFALAMKFHGGLTMGQGKEYQRIAEELRAGGGKHADVLGWAAKETGISADKIPMAGLNNLSKLWMTRKDSLASQEEMLTSMGETYQHGGRLPKELGEELKQALEKTGDDRAEALRKVLPKAIMSVKDENNAKEIHDKMGSMADSAMDKMGEAGKIIVDKAFVTGQALGDLVEVISGTDGLMAKFRALGSALMEIPGVAAGVEASKKAAWGAVGAAGAAAGAVAGAIIPSAEASVKRRETHGPSAGGTKGLLDLIGAAESGGRLDAISGDGGTSPAPGLSKMPVREVLKWQQDHGEPAAGKYQFISPTLKRHAEKLGLMDAPFDSDTQDKLALEEMKGAGLSDYQSGAISPEVFQERLSKKFQALPKDATGKPGLPYKDGRDAIIPHDKASKAIRAAREPAAREPAAGGKMLTGAFSAAGLDIDYRGDATKQYSKTGTANAEPFTGILFHHPGEGTLDGLVDYGKTKDPGRGGHSYGYHFYIDRDGKTVQGAPMEKRTNHVVGRDGYRNRRTIGIALLGAEHGAAEAQLKASTSLGLALQDQLDLDPSRVAGHDDVQTGKMPGEGAQAAKRLKEAARRRIEAQPAPLQPKDLTRFDVTPGAARPAGGKPGPKSPLAEELFDLDPSLRDEVRRRKGVDAMPPDITPGAAPSAALQPSARWEGQVAMDITFRDPSGRAIQQKQAMAVSEPRLPGTGGSRTDSSRFSWYDSVTWPGVA